MQSQTQRNFATSNGLTRSPFKTIKWKWRHWAQHSLWGSRLKPRMQSDTIHNLLQKNDRASVPPLLSAQVESSDTYSHSTQPLLHLHSSLYIVITIFNYYIYIFIWIMHEKSLTILSLYTDFNVYAHERRWMDMLRCCCVVLCRMMK